MGYSWSNFAKKDKRLLAVYELVELKLMIRPGRWNRPNFRLATGEVKETNCVKEYEGADKVGFLSPHSPLLVSFRFICYDLCALLSWGLDQARRHSFNIVLNPSGYLHQQMDPGDLKSSQQQWNSSIFVKILYFTTRKDRVLGWSILKGERLWTIVILLQ